MLKLNNISKTFNPGTVNEKTALSGLTLDVHDGDFITIIGANGAGKSTLFNAIAGSFFTDSGSIELDGRDITFMPEHKRARMIGRLFQDPMRGSAPGMSIEENLARRSRCSWRPSFRRSFFCSMSTLLHSIPELRKRFWSLQRASLQRTTSPA